MNGTTRALPMSWMALIVALLLAVAMVACGDDEGTDADEPAAQGKSEAPEEETTPEEEESTGDITVTATEFSFDLPPTLPAGSATFTLRNDGEQTHHLIMAKLTEDAPPIDELIKVRNSDKFLEEDLTGNRPPLAKPGETAEQTIETELTPGTYAYVCFMPDKKTKKPHAFLGMYGTFEVE